ncbi:MAG TPA: carboxypeptidase regulatory-like domain-containing protein [Pyrinomonadaceae bacterium]|nr:carboxypeptidase regulatory-like domain-containing protein [Pyrinomonadaceae bacterium]
MRRPIRFLLAALLLLSLTAVAFAQTTGTLSGTAQDEKGGAVAGATVTARHVETNVSRSAQTDSEGRYRLTSMPVGHYEITVESQSFAKYVQTGVNLLLNQDAVVDAVMKPAGVEAVVNVTENASLLNTTNVEVGTRFDERRLSELPLATNRNVYNVALSAAGVSQLQSNQSTFTNGINYSANGGRLRSNNFLIDGQDNNDFGVAGAVVGLNNPDLIQEVRLVTNQFTAEFGRNSSSVFNAITKAGTNSYHGSGFWFHNDNALNACSNLNKAAGFCRPEGLTLAAGQSYKRPFRVENQLGGTVGGPLILPRFGEGGRSTINGKDRTFFFFSVQRWWDRRLGQGVTVSGVPTAEGRAILQQRVGNRPQVAALLGFLPAAQTSNGATESFTVGGVTTPVPLGNLTGSSSFLFNDWQTSIRLDHRFNQNHTLMGRYIYQDQDTAGSGQSTPPGYESSNVSRNQGVNISLTSVLGPRVVNEARAAFLRAGSASVASDLKAEAIPSIQITSLGLQGLNAGATRTAIGLAANLPQNSIRNTYQLQDNISYASGDHAFKFGVDIHRSQLHQLFKPTTRGHLVYANLNAFVNDTANVQINRDLPGVARVLHLDWHDFFFYGQDEWKIRPNFTLTYGLRYELPGQPIADLVDFNAPVLAASGNDPRYRVTPIPEKDKNNFEPRVGFNWNPRHSGGPLGLLTGGDKLVLRGGYARTHDYAFTNIALNIWSSFPFVAAFNLTNVPNAFATYLNQPVNPATFTRTQVTPDFHAPQYDSFSLEVQRELTRDMVLRVGYVGSKGTGLFESIDGNPVVFRAQASNNATNVPVRADPLTGPIRLRANSGNSIYHSMQASLEKRLTRGFSGGLHFTWSSFIDTMSEIFNNSNAEIAVAQDPFNRAAERGRSSYDRPLRLAGNFVYELPWFQGQKGFAGHLLGGWQFNGFLNFQSGAPFSPLNGTDPTGTLGGLASAIGIATRPNVITTVDLAHMSVEELFGLRGAVNANGNALFRTLQCAGAGATQVCERAGNAGRNILRADGINNMDFGIVKNTSIGETQKLQIRADFFNVTNTRDFGTPQSVITNSGFLNQWGTDGGNRRIIVGLRYIF